MPFMKGAIAAAVAIVWSASASHTFASASVSHEAIAKYEAFRRHFGTDRADDVVGYHQRLWLFQRTLNAIDAQNSKPGAMWTAGLNRFADYTDDEFNALLGHRSGLRGRASQGVQPSSFMQGGAHKRADDIIINRDNIDLAEEVDWAVDNRTARTVSQVKEQGACGSCWAVAAVGAIEVSVEKKYQEVRTFSFEQMVDCTGNPKDCGGEGGCRGATAELGFAWARSGELGEQDSYNGYGKLGDTKQSSLPDEEERRKVCEERSQIATAGPRVKISDYIRLPENVLWNLKHAVATKGPVVVSVDGTGFSLYNHGVFNGCSRNAVINHAVLLTGYGKAKNTKGSTEMERLNDNTETKYWLIRNSWGPNWGEKGYMRLLRHEGDIHSNSKEEGWCGIDENPKAGVACKDNNGEYPKQMEVCGMCGILSDSSYPEGVELIQPRTGLLQHNIAIRKEAVPRAGHSHGHDQAQ